MKMKQIVAMVLCFMVLLCAAGCADSTSSPTYHAAAVNSPSSSSEETAITDAPEEALDGDSPEGMSSEPVEGSEVPCAPIPAVMIEGTVYYLSQGYPIPDKEVDSDPAGYTESVSQDIYPEKDGESNYAPAGTPYVEYGNGYALKIEKYGWTLFLTWEERLAEE